MSHAEGQKTRQPLPSREVIAQLPEDGGEEFNRLVFSQSPYLLQHARNPVDWWPWSEEAFARAKEEGKFVFLSIGYATCHWCHVMEHESFEDPEVAAFLNEHTIPVKVDREERPDIDEIYMQVTQAISGGGGWPMTVMLTPDKHAFFAGTYFPKESRGGRPGVKELITDFAQVWKTRREEVEATAGQISEQLASLMGASPGGELDQGIFDIAFAKFVEQYDEERGGFGVAPKFPVPPNLMFLLRFHQRTGSKAALEMVETTLAEMRRGGIYDQIGFGLHRYAVDREWLVPHFEKMLYDQALFVLANLEAYQVTGKEEYARTAREVLTYVQRELTDENGGFYSAEDADSEGEEGRFYVWTVEEVRQLLDEDDAAFFMEHYQLVPEGNFLDEVTRQKDGRNIPHLQSDLDESARQRFEKIRLTLFDHRNKRVHPFKDDKILTDWNALMIAAFARAAQVLDDESYQAVAVKATDFVLEKLTNESGRLWKRYRQGEAGLDALAEDYAFMIWALLDVYETTFDVEYLERAVAFQKILDEQFWDDREGGYFTTAHDAEKLIVRAKKLYGGAIPTGNAVSIGNLSRLYRMTGGTAYAERVDELVRAFSAEIEGHAMAFPMALTWLDFHLASSHEIVISGEDPGEFVRAIRRPFLPNKVVIWRSEANADRLARIVPYTETQRALGGKTTAYVCRDFACDLPTTELEKVLASLGLEPSRPE